MRNLLWAIALEGYYQDCRESAPDYPRQAAATVFAFHVMFQNISDAFEQMMMPKAITKPSWYEAIDAG